MARVDVSNGSTLAILSADRDAYNNYLNFAFTLDGSDVIFTYGQGTPEDSRLIIERESGGTITTILNERKLICHLDILDSIGGAFLGCYETVLHDDFLYMTVPIARRNRDIERTAGLALYRYGLGTLQLDLLKTWEL